MNKQKQRTCVFAGASGGDGVAAVKKLCSRGIHVVMMTHQLEQAQALIEEISEMNYPGRCTAYMDGKCYQPPKTDAEVFEEIYREFGSIDIIISNTGGPEKDDSIDTVSTELLLEEVTHLLGGGYTMLKNALPYLRKSEYPRVIFMTTIDGIYGGKHGSLATSIAKGAVNSMLKNCAARLMEEGITVNGIAKGAIERLPDKSPQMSDASQNINQEKLLPYIPAGRIGTPEDLAQAICYLADTENSYMTGTVLDLSGGLSLM